MATTIEQTERGARVVHDGDPSPWATVAEVKVLSTMSYADASRIKPRHRRTRNALAAWLAGYSEGVYTSAIQPAASAWTP